MQLYVKFVDEWMLESNQRGTTPLFIIFWKLKNTYYPCKEWIDLGAVILDWWLLALERIKGGSTHEDLVFREGPYRLKLIANHKNNILTVGTKKETNLVEISIDAFINELVKAARTTVKKLEELNIAQSSQKDLMEGIRIATKENSLFTRPFPRIKE